MENVGRLLIWLGALALVAGIILVYGDRIGLDRLPLGRLPGDIRIERENFHFYFPITTMILLSLAASAILWLWSWLKK